MDAALDKYLFETERFSFEIFKYTQRKDLICRIE